MFTPDALYASVIDDFVAAAAESRGAWADRALLELLDRGVTLERISIQEHPGGVTRICLDHAPVTEWKIVYPEITRD